MIFDTKMWHITIDIEKSYDKEQIKGWRNVNVLQPFAF